MISSYAYNISSSLRSKMVVPSFKEITLSGGAISCLTGCGFWVAPLCWAGPEGSAGDRVWYSGGGTEFDWLTPGVEGGTGDGEFAVLEF